MSLQYSNNVCVIIPFYNEKNSIKEVIEKSLAFCKYVVAVNDGSTDGSEKYLPDSEKVYLVSCARNQGKGNALKEGFRKSIQLNSELTITLDADLQHPPDLIPEFIKKIDNSDIVIGNRMKNKTGMPFQRILSNTLTSKLLSLKTGYTIEDSQCGYRIYRTSVLPFLFTKSPGYEAESEILILAAKQKLRISFVDIPSIYANEISKIKPVESISGFLKVLFR